MTGDYDLLMTALHELQAKLAEYKDTIHQQHEQLSAHKEEMQDWQRELMAAKSYLAECERKCDQLKGSRDSYAKAYDDCRAAHTTTHAKLVECERGRNEARANDRHAMSYLSMIRSVVGGKDFPDMVARVMALAKLGADKTE